MDDRVIKCAVIINGVIYQFDDTDLQLIGTSLELLASHDISKNNLTRVMQLIHLLYEVNL